MMNAENIRLIVCDVDNTIIPQHCGIFEISERLRTDFHKAIDKGIKVMINTGRHYTFLQPSLFEDLPMELIGTINGACVVDRNGRVIEKHCMTEENMNALTKICQENDIGLGFKFEDRIVTYAHHDKFCDGYVDPASGLRDTVLNDCEKRTHHLEYGYPIGTFIIGDEKVIESYADAVPGLTFAWSQPDGYDVFLSDINKASSVEAALRYWNLSWDNVIAFGDAGNDTPFIKKAAIGVALGNARDAVKAQADIVADTCKNDGCAKVLEELGIV